MQLLRCVFVQASDRQQTRYLSILFLLFLFVTSASLVCLFIEEFAAVQRQMIRRREEDSNVDDDVQREDKITFCHTVCIILEQIGIHVASCNWKRFVWSEINMNWYGAGSDASNVRWSSLKRHLHLMFFFVDELFCWKLDKRICSPERRTILDRDEKRSRRLEILHWCYWFSMLLVRTALLDVYKDSEWSIERVSVIIIVIKTRRRLLWYAFDYVLSICFF